MVRNIVMAGFIGLLSCLAVAVWADDLAGDLADNPAGLQAEGAYARILPGAKAGAVFLTLHNGGLADDRLIGAETDLAEMSALHQHEMMADGTMHMGEMADGAALPAGGDFAFAPGGAHVMLMGLRRKVAAGERFDLTLTFEKAGDLTLSVVVDNDR
ncbi:MAG: copper chaperone PCu(A)C [Paracoccaceae bacterium]